MLHSIFQYNIPLSDEELPGGRGVSIFFTYCKPCNTSMCNLTNKFKVVNSFLILLLHLTTWCFFILHVIYATIHQQFGCGGGLNVIMRGKAQNNTIITDCSFVYNQAVWGGGLFVGLLDETLKLSFYFAKAFWYKQSIATIHCGFLNMEVEL